MRIFKEINPEPTDVQRARRAKEKGKMSKRKRRKLRACALCRTMSYDGSGISSCGYRVGPITVETSRSCVELQRIRELKACGVQS